MIDSALLAYFTEALRWLGYIWGGLTLAAFILFYVYAAATGAGEDGSLEADAEEPTAEDTES